MKFEDFLLYDRQHRHGGQSEDTDELPPRRQFKCDVAPMGGQFDLEAGDQVTIKSTRQKGVLIDVDRTNDEDERGLVRLLEDESEVHVSLEEIAGNDNTGVAWRYRVLRILREIRGDALKVKDLSYIKKLKWVLLDDEPWQVVVDQCTAECKALKKAAKGRAAKREVCTCDFNPLGFSLQRADEAEPFVPTKEVLKRKRIRYTVRQIEVTAHEWLQYKMREIYEFLGGVLLQEYTKDFGGALCGSGPVGNIGQARPVRDETPRIAMEHVKFAFRSLYNEYFCDKRNSELQAPTPISMCLRRPS